MGKRRSHMRQNATFQRIESTPQEATVAAESERFATTPGAADTLRPASTRRPYQGSVSPSNDSSDGIRSRMWEPVGWLEENPLALALGGVALGVLCGLLLPVSEAETERLGAVGENLAGQVQEHVQALGQDVVEHGKAVVVETVQAAILGGTSPVDAVQQSVQEHLVTVAQNAQARVEASLRPSAQDV